MVHAQGPTTAPGKRRQPHSPTSTPLQYDTLYAATSTDLWILDAKTGNATYIGPLSYITTDIAFSGTSLYGVTFTDLLSIDPTTGNTTDIGYTGYGNINSLAVAPDGTLYAATGDGILLKINGASGIGYLVGYFGSGMTSNGDLAFRDDGVLFAAVNNPGYSNTWLATVDPISGTANPIGDIGFQNVLGLSFKDGVLYGVTAQGELLRISTSTGSGTLLGISSPSYWGLATSPLPVASSFLRYPLANPDLNTSKTYYRFWDPTWYDGPHKGVDWTQSFGANVLAVSDGILVRATTDPTGYGNYVVIKHFLPSGEVVCSLYAHLKDFAVPMTTDPSQAIPISMSHVVGHEDTTGQAGGHNHVHFEIRKESKCLPAGFESGYDKYNYYDPDIFLQQHQPPAVYDPNLGKNVIISMEGSPTRTDSATISPGITSSPVTYVLNQLTRFLMVVLNWHGSTLQLTVYDPSGNIYSVTESSSPPIILNIPSASAGTWSYTVTALDVPYNNYPYFVDFGELNTPVPTFVEGPLSNNLYLPLIVR